MTTTYEIYTMYFDDDVRTDGNNKKYFYTKKEAKEEPGLRAVLVVLNEKNNFVTIYKYKKITDFQEDYKTLEKQPNIKNLSNPYIRTNPMELSKFKNYALQRSEMPKGKTVSYTKEEEVEEEEEEEKPKKKKKGTASDTKAISKESLSKPKPKEDTPVNSMEEVTIKKKKKKRKLKIIPKEIVKARDLSKQPAPPRKSAGQRVRALRSDKDRDHNWSDGRDSTTADNKKTRVYKANEDVDWSEVRCNGDTCWKTKTRKTDATTANKKAKGKKVYAYNKATGHYGGQLRRKKKKKTEFID